MGGISGNAYVKVASEEYDPEEDPDLYELYPQGRIRLLLLPPGSVFPKWYGHDRDRMVECRIIYKVNIEDGLKVREAVYKEILTKKSIKIYLDGELLEERENPIGEIPVVRIKNISQAGDSFGRGDISDLIPLQKEYNNTSTDIADIINYHGQPITVVKGAKSSNLEKGARKIWGGLPKDADIFNLELKSDLGASISYLNMIKTAIFEIGSMPEDALKGKEHVSNASGIALHVKNQPILDMTHKKWVTYGQGICDINRLILKTAVYLKLENFDIGAFQELPITVKYYTETIFADPLPKDILIQMQVLAQKLQLGLESRIGALKDLGEPDPAAKLGEIKDELQEMQDLVYDMGVASGNALETNVGGVVLRDEKVDPNINKDNVKEEGSQLKDSLIFHE
jgi:hypothetical protein